MIDQTAFFSLSYGLYVISSKDADRAAGCVANTFQQVTSSPMQVSVALNKGNATTGVIRSAGRFSATCLAQDAPMELIGTFGFHCSDDLDKFAACGLTPVRLDALPETPAVAQAPICLACRVQSVQELGSHDLFLARILQVYVQERLFGEKGEIVMERARLCAYSHGEYRALGRMLGFFGYSIASPEALARRMPDRTRKGR